jgi:hypothetical protein
LDPFLAKEKAGNPIALTRAARPVRPNISRREYLVLFTVQIVASRMRGVNDQEIPGTIISSPKTGFSGETNPLD